MEFSDWRVHVDNRLDKQDKAALRIEGKLDTHIEATRKLEAKVTPVVETIDAMSAGVKVIGWIGSKMTAIGLFIAAIIGAVAAWKGWK